MISFNTLVLVPLMRKELFFTMKSKIYKSIIVTVFISAATILLLNKHYKTSSIEETVNIAKKESLPRLLELGSHNCVPCKMMMPVLDTLRQKHKDKLKIDFIDVWEDRKAGAQYSVKSIPTQIFFDQDGNELFRHVGFWSRQDIESKFAELGIKLNGKI